MKTSKANGNQHCRLYLQLADNRKPSPEFYKGGPCKIYVQCLYHSVLYKKEDKGHKDTSDNLNRASAPVEGDTCYSLVALFLYAVVLAL